MALMNSIASSSSSSTPSRGTPMHASPLDSVHSTTPTTPATTHPSSAASSPQQDIDNEESGEHELKNDKVSIFASFNNGL